MMTPYQPFYVLTAASLMIFCGSFFLLRDSSQQSRWSLKPKSYSDKVNLSSTRPTLVPFHGDAQRPHLSKNPPLTFTGSFYETTSANFTTVEILNDKTFFNLGDVLVVRIISRDWRGKLKTYGGDVFRVKIYSETPYSAVFADSITDFNKGTYLVQFTLRWSGHVKLQIKLICPVELLPLLRDILEGKAASIIEFLGVFVSNNVSEEVICRPVELPSPSCNLSSPRTHGPWFCHQPRDPRLTCNDWTFQHNAPTSWHILDDLTPLSEEIFRKSYMAEVKNNYTLNVRNQTASNIFHVHPARPFCSMRDPIPIKTTAAGHFFNNSWYPNDCKVFRFTPTEAMFCLRNKRIMIIGDSTIRQIFGFFQNDISYKKYFRSVQIVEGADRNNGPTKILNDEYNVSIWYRFHGLPRFGKIMTKVAHIKYTADVLDSIESGSEVVLLLSIWAHFVPLGKAFYVQRLKAIKAAVQRLLNRCPMSSVILKGANVKGDGDLIAKLFGEWNIMKHEMELRKLFQDEKRVGFIDAFDITRVQPYKENTHPHEKIVEEFVNRILTYLCKS